VSPGTRGLSARASHGRLFSEQTAVSARAPAGISPLVAQELVARYEALRRGIVDGVGWHSGLGLAVLRREGLAAWIAAWATVATPPPTGATPAPQVPVQVADDRQAEVVRRLAGMALPRLAGRMHHDA
jgi:hypothetical protein